MPISIHIDPSLLVRSLHAPCTTQHFTSQINSVFSVMNEREAGLKGSQLDVRIYVPSQCVYFITDIKPATVLGGVASHRYNNSIGHIHSDLKSTSHMSGVENKI